MQTRVVGVTTQQNISIPPNMRIMNKRTNSFIQHIMKEYLGDKGATKATITKDRWLKISDIAYFDEGFDFYITDRLKKLINVN